MALRGIKRGIAVLTACALAGLSGDAGARMAGSSSGLEYSSIKRLNLPIRPAGLWDKPNEVCTTKCQIHVRKGCFKKLSDKDPTASAGAIQDKCDDKYSLCLYDCMCDTCDENQIIIKEQ